MEFYDKKELAALLRVSPRTIERWVKAGTLSAPLQVGRKALWSRAVVEAMAGVARDAGKDGSERGSRAEDSPVTS
jgi:excisionase family DNA binding protein